MVDRTLRWPAHALAVVMLIYFVYPLDVMGTRVSGAWGGQAKIAPKSDTYDRRHKEKVCDDLDFRKRSLKLVKETPFIGLFPDLKGHHKFEASAMATARGKLWVVFDSSYAIGVLDEHFSFRGENNTLVGEVGQDSQFEGFTYVKRSGTFLAVQEAVDHKRQGLVPQTMEFKVADDLSEYSIIRKCPVNFLLVHSNKGFEGLHYFENAKGEQFIMGLCEGNFCKGGTEGREPGNGRVVIAQFTEDLDDDTCEWDVKKIVHIPEGAYFTDYSGFAFKGEKVGVLSQENASLWVSTFDFETWEFDANGEMFHFPRNEVCDIMYCNVEGMQWLDDQRIVVASDKAKSVQPYSCSLKDQSIHIFAIPLLDDPEL